MRMEITSIVAFFFLLLLLSLHLPFHIWHLATVRFGRADGVRLLPHSVRVGWAENIISSVLPATRLRTGC